MILKGKRAVVTGSNSGIGLGVAVELAKAGAEVVINSFTDRPEDHALAAQIASVPEQIRGYGHVKHAHLERAKAREADLLQEWQAAVAAA